jgi:hypothetical protein
VKTINRGWLTIAALVALVPGACLAQAPAAGRAAASAHATPRPDELEPGVDTSADEHASQVRETPVVAAPAAAAARNKADKTAKAGTKPAGQKGGTGKPEDHLQLDATQITGNRELPKVMVIVPWKRADLGDLAGKPMNSLVDEVLQPIDRDVFQRQTRYYDALKPDTPAAPAAGAPPPPAPGGGH